MRKTVLQVYFTNEETEAQNNGLCWPRLLLLVSHMVSSGNVSAPRACSSGFHTSEPLCRAQPSVVFFFDLVIVIALHVQGAAGCPEDVSGVLLVRLAFQPGRW